MALAADLRGLFGGYSSLGPYDSMYDTSVDKTSAFMFSCCYFHFLLLVTGDH